MVDCGPLAFGGGCTTADDGVQANLALSWRDVMIALALLLAISAAPADAAKCSMLDAVYKSADDPSFTLTVARLASHSEVVSDIGLHLHSNNPEDESWWYFDEGSARRISLIATLDPTVAGWKPEPDGGTRVYGSPTFVGMSANGDIVESVPQANSMAPYYVIIPELADMYRKHKKSTVPVLSSSRPAKNRTGGVACPKTNGRPILGSAKCVGATGSERKRK